MRFFTMLAMMAALMIGAGTITGCGGDGKDAKKDTPASGAKDAAKKDAAKKDAVAPKDKDAAPKDKDAPAN